jgi:hypothetical protein
MVEPVVEPIDKLSLEDIRAIPSAQRGKFIESSVLALINSNDSRGLTLAEIERLTQYPKNTLYKHIDLLFAKRKITKISRGRISIYYPNGYPSGEPHMRDIIYGKGNDHRIGVHLLENIDGKYVHIQERELDENGFSQDIGGVLVPVAIIPELINSLLKLQESVEILNHK